jgi:hypothetical protein
MINLINSKILSYFESFVRRHQRQPESILFLNRRKKGRCPIHARSAHAPGTAAETGVPEGFPEIEAVISLDLMLRREKGPRGSLTCNP